MTHRIQMKFTSEMSQTRFKNLTALLTVIPLLVSGCTTAHYQRNSAATATEETQLACETYGRIEKEIVHGASLSEMLILPVVLGPMVLWIGPQWVMGLKPAIENDKKRDKIFGEALNTCLNPNMETADLLRIAGRRYHARKDYAEAEVLYRRALAIEAVLPQDEIRAGILEDYGQLMWVTERRGEGQEMFRRARSIRVTLDQKKQTEANLERTDKDDTQLP